MHQWQRKSQSQMGKAYRVHQLTRYNQVQEQYILLFFDFYHSYDALTPLDQDV
jgi:hypothetical protein